MPAVEIQAAFEWWSPVRQSRGLCSTGVFPSGQIGDVMTPQALESVRRFQRPLTCPANRAVWRQWLSVATTGWSESPLVFIRGREVSALWVVIPRVGRGFSPAGAQITLRHTQQEGGMLVVKPGP